MSTDILEASHRQGREACSLLRLPFRKRSWRGQSGVWVGKESGSSIDFRDHRPYMPGDDPRHINWQAYARSGHYSMKVFQEEIQPELDVIFDFSRSMSDPEVKRDRALQLLYFACEQAWMNNARLRVFCVAGGTHQRVDPARLISRQWDLNWHPEMDGLGSPLQGLKLNPEGIRIFISDCLFEMDARVVLSPLAMPRGLSFLFVPFSVEESDPAWNGNLELIDSERGVKRRQRFTGPVLGRYRELYQRHMRTWKEESARAGILMCRVQAEVSLTLALKEEGLSNGVLEAVI